MYGPYRKLGGKQHRFPLSCENCRSGGPNLRVSRPSLGFSLPSSPPPRVSHSAVADYRHDNYLGCLSKCTFLGLTLNDAGCGLGGSIKEMADL